MKHLKPLSLLSSSAATVLHMSLLSRVDTIHKVYANDRAGLETELSLLRSCAFELGFDLDGFIDDYSQTIDNYNQKLKSTSTK